MSSRLVVVSFILLSFSRITYAGDVSCTAFLAGVQWLKDRNFDQQLAESLASESRDEVSVLSDDYKKLLEASQYSLSAGGKRLRPLLVYATAVFFNASPDPLMPLALAVEKLHTASLILDDMPHSDDESLRRGRPSNHVVFGVATSELAAVSLLESAVRDLNRLNDRYFYYPKDELEYRKKVQKVIDYGMKGIGLLGLGRGQVADLSHREKMVSLQELKDITYYKTGLGLEIPILATAMLSGIVPAEVDILKSYARILGEVFQMRDDLLDLESSSDETGKGIGNDQKNKTATYVKVLGPEATKLEIESNVQRGRDILKSLGRSREKTLFFEKLLYYAAYRSK